MRRALLWLPRWLLARWDAADTKTASALNPWSDDE